ncbi:MAG TPA: hypothetical protein VIT19_10170 [Pyrinomonadaceae bacterium]
MLKLTRMLKEHRFATITLTSLGVGLISGVLVWSSLATRPQVEPTVASKTPSVRVLASEKISVGGSSILAVKLQNTSSKDIEAYIISRGKSWVTTNYLLTEQSFASGAIVSDLIPLSDNDSQSLNAFADSTGRFFVSAVVFSDGTGDGDARFVKMLSDERAGTRDQAKKISPHLSGLFRPGSDQLRAITDLEAEIRKLPDKGNESASADYEIGLANAKRKLLKDVKDMKEKLQSNRPDEANIKREKLSRIFTRLAESH